MRPLGTPCNTVRQLCSRPYDEGLQLTTHLSAATAVAGWTSIAQGWTLRQQLDSGVTALSLEVFDQGGTLAVCDRDCSKGSTPLSVFLEELKAFLTVNTPRVETLLVESHVERRRLGAALADFGPLLYTHDGGPTWPTLQRLIDDGTRLVVLAATPEASGDGGGFADAAPPLDASVDHDAARDEAGADAFPWLHPMDRWIRQTRTDATVAGQIDCALVRGDSDAPWIALHLHINDPKGIPSPALAATVNTQDVIMDRLRTCRTLNGHLPNFVSFDFVDISEPQATLRGLNDGRLSL